MRRQTLTRRGDLQIALVVLCLVGVWGGAAPSVTGEETVTLRSGPTATAVPVSDTLDPYVEEVSEILADFEMRPVPGGTVAIETADGTKEVEVDPFWIKATEVKWGPYQTFVYGRDQESGEGVDAVSRPTNALPYIAADFGDPRDEHPARAMTRKAARNYARWLSQKTGHTYRLPTAAQWVHACQLGLGPIVEEAKDSIDEYAWHEGNSEENTHPVGAKEADELGVYDLLGNVVEWTFTPSDSTRHHLRGGSYQTERRALNCSTVLMEQTDAWKEGDPQMPKSKWWFASAPFVGFRVVRVPDGP